MSCNPSQQKKYEKIWSFNDLPEFAQKRLQRFIDDERVKDSIMCWYNEYFNDKFVQTDAAFTNDKKRHRWVSKYH